MNGSGVVERLRNKLVMTGRQSEKLTRFGFRFGRSSVHCARTMMLEELRLVISHVPEDPAARQYYVQAIEQDNCLGKRSGKTRALTARHLIDLYALDPNTNVFRSLLFFWRRDEAAQPLLALLCAYARDPLLRMSAPFILEMCQGQEAAREALEEFLDSREPGRFSKTTLKSVAQNINSTWTQSGHLKGRVKKVRSRANATAGSAAYALLLGYLADLRGETLLSSEYARILDCPTDRAIELAEEASRRGWIVFKRIERVMEALFPQLLTEQELEWIREQS